MDVDMAAQAKGTGRAKPKAPANPRTAAKPQAPAKPQAAPEPEPAAQPPAALRLAAAAQALEAVGLCVAGVFGVISTVDGKASQLAAGIVISLLAFGTAAGLVTIAVALARARPWSRIPAVMTQLFVGIVGLALVSGRPGWGVPALVLAVVCVAGLLTPASLRALNRTSVPAFNSDKDE
jgi:hypothetical protein